MLKTPDKFQSMILGSTNLDFTLLLMVLKLRDVNHNIDLLGINIDSHNPVSK